MRRWTAIAALLTLLALIVASAAVKAQARSGPVEAVVTDERGNPVADVGVTLTSLGAPAPLTPRVTVVMDQHEKELVHTKFELPLYIGTPAAPVLFDKPGVVALGCGCREPLTTFRKWWSEKHPFDQ